MKSLFARWFKQKVALLPEQQTRLMAWQQAASAALDVPLARQRCVVVDVESSGLDLNRDRLISIGAVALVNGKIALGDSFYIVLQQPEASSKGNILLHGIGGTAQLQGVPPIEGLLAFLEYLGRAPLIAFHVSFDETMIRRALREHLGYNFKHPWLDLAYVMPALYPELARKCRALDDWITRFGIRIEARHNALADALATAQLAQVAAKQAAAQDIMSWQGLHELEQAQRWMGN